MAKQRKSMTKLPFDIISVGDCGMDMFLGMNTSGSKKCSINKRECELTLNYADKIEADSQEYAIGGNSANLSVGAARLGLKAGFYTELGADSIGGLVVDTLKGEKVSTDYVKRERGAKTNFHVVLNHDAERTIIIYHNHRSYNLPNFKKAAWVYYSSMGEGFQKIQPALIKYVKQNKVKLGFNPGTLQFKAGYKVLKKVLKVTEILILNTEEGHRLLGDKTNGQTDFKDLLNRLAKLGPKQVVVTDGPEGAYAFDGRSYWYMPIYDVPVLERTGAGDAFSTGVITSLAYGNTLQEALRWGTFSSSGVVQEVGPQKGLLKKSQMKKLLKENPDLVAEQI